jgi:polyhydroxyalkanoate synthase
MVRFLVGSGIQTFAISWRNPTAAHREWGLDTYVAAVDAAREITGCEDISMMGSCSGGITSTAYFATLGSAVEKKIKTWCWQFVCWIPTRPRTAPSAA